ncbi:hypothetical protein KAU88_06640 [Candidatus Bathyarchaeota archaeon]|nr:hypothetical protein [Candidatus Bathyarchaeota archaeon]
MKDDDKKADVTIRRLMRSSFIKRLSRRYPIDIFSDRNNIVIRIELRGKRKELIDVFDIEVSEEGTLDVEQALHYVIMSWELGLGNAEWEAGMKNIRQSEF